MVWSSEALEIQGYSWWKYVALGPSGHSARGTTVTERLWLLLLSPVAALHLQGGPACEAGSVRLADGVEPEGARCTLHRATLGPNLSSVSSSRVNFISRKRPTLTYKQTQSSITQAYIRLPKPINKILMSNITPFTAERTKFSLSLAHTSHTNHGQAGHLSHHSPVIASAFTSYRQVGLRKKVPNLAPDPARDQEILHQSPLAE